MSGKVVAVEDDVIEEDKCELSFYLCEDDVDGALKRSGCVLKSEWNACKPEQSFVQDEYRLVAILWGDWDLSITAIAVQWREDIGISKQIDAVVHMGNCVCVADRHYVKAALVDAEP